MLSTEPSGSLAFASNRIVDVDVKDISSGGNMIDIEAFQGLMHLAQGLKRPVH